MSSLYDDVAALVLSTFDQLPAKYKPRHLGDGRREWVPIAGIVAVREAISKAQDDPHTLHCVAVATGMKCLPRDKIPLARGNVLHDWHAEILVMRGFNRWVLDECEALTMGLSSSWLQWTREGEEAMLPFRLKQDTSLYMYVSAAPCGDASMELTMAAQDDSTPWTKPPPSARPDDMIGRAHFDQLGVVRRKPSRPDAPSTWSKSCSDKLAMKQCTGLLCGLVSQLVEPIYLKALVLPQDQVSEVAIKRAWSKSGRMAALAVEEVNERWSQHGFAFNPFDVGTTKHEFAYRKLPGAPSSNLAMLWTPRRQEALVNGVLMGRKQFDVRGGSCVSRRAMWQAIGQVAVAAGVVAAAKIAKIPLYSAAKYGAEAREHVKDDVKKLALQGWRQNDGDDDWSL